MIETRYVNVEQESDKMPIIEVANTILEIKPDSNTLITSV